VAAPYVHEASENAADVELCLELSVECECHKEEAETKRNTEANEGHFAVKALHGSTNQQGTKATARLYSKNKIINK